MYYLISTFFLGYLIYNFLTTFCRLGYWTTIKKIEDGHYEAIKNKHLPKPAPVAKAEKSEYDWTKEWS